MNRIEEVSMEPESTGKTRKKSTWEDKKQRNRPSNLSRPRKMDPRFGDKWSISACKKPLERFQLQTRLWKMVIARKHRLQASPNLKVGIGHYRDLLSLNASPKIEALKARRTKQKFGEKRHQCFISDLLFFFFRSTIHVVFVFQSLVLDRKSVV